MEKTGKTRLVYSDKINLMYCTMTAGGNRFALTRVSSFRNGSANIAIRAISGAFFIGPPRRTRFIKIENEGREFLFAAAGYRLGTSLYHGNNYVRLLRDYFCSKVFNFVCEIFVVCECLLKRDRLLRSDIALYCGFGDFLVHIFWN